MVDRLVSLFEQPSLPSFVPRGSNNVVFDVPTEYLSSRYSSAGQDIITKFGGDDVTHVPVSKITLPDLTALTRLGRNEPFSDFLPQHRQMASALIKILMGMRSVEDLTSIGCYCRDNLNPFLFNYAMSVALMHRDDTKNISLPSLTETFPEKFLGNSTFGRIREEVLAFDEEDRNPIDVVQDYSAANVEEEQRLAYFREDLGVNLHHWHWHLVYPFDAPPEVVAKDRRGELFYYMHQQIVARYNLERLSNRMPRVKRLNNFREPIKEGYYPKLDSLVSNKSWAARQPRSVMRDIDRGINGVTFDIADLERWRERFFLAIHTGTVINTQGEQVELTETTGIDILGNMMESSLLSINKNMYGDLHNYGHIAISSIHDPEDENQQGIGVMGDSATAMRDPVFYRWHAMVDSIFQEYKNTLPRYTFQQLDFSGVKVTNVEVNVLGKTKAPKNRIQTYWQKSDINLSRGMDFNSRGPVYARFQHLQHAPFSYKISIENTGAVRLGTVRIFLAPKFDERGQAMSFSVQKNLCIELDKFQVNLKTKTNVFERHSIDSSVTIPFERTFRNLDSNRPGTGTDQLTQFNFCGCGWPDHMLLPRGAPEGIVFELFVMVSDNARDKINQRVEGVCTDAASFCGLRDKFYPDKRAMGFPFDRLPRPGVDTLAEFLTPNMKVQDIIIEFSDRVGATRSAAKKPQ